MNSVSRPVSQQYRATVLATERSQSPEAHWNNQEKTYQVKQADLTELTGSPTDLTVRNLSEYASYCHSLRNFIETPKHPQGSAPPESLVSEADERILSINELDVMHQHMSQQTEITIGGVDFTLETLPENAPLFYQFYCMNNEAFIDDRSIRIFNNNCAVENLRHTIILTHSELMNDRVERQVVKLVRENKNVFSVDMKKLLPKLSVDGIRIIGKKDNEGKFFLRIESTDHHSRQSKQLRTGVRELRTLANIMDAFQCIAMFHYDKICKAAGVVGNSSGCMKVDWDTEFIARMRKRQCPSGFMTFVIDNIERNSTSNSDNHLNHSLRAEMSLVAVTRPGHPIMAESLKGKRSIYINFRIAVANFFLQPHSVPECINDEVALIPDNLKILEIMCSTNLRDKIVEKIAPDQPLTVSFLTTTSWLQKISFPLEKIKADQSRAWGICSWKKTEPASASQTSVRETGILKGRACNIL